MSLQIAIAKHQFQTASGPRSQHRGDPGLFSFIGKAVKSVAKLIPGVGNVISGIEGAVTLLSGNKGKPLNPSIALKPLPASLVQAQPTPSINQYGLVNVGQGLPPLQMGGPGNTTQGGNAGTDWNSSARETSGTACRSGYHYNKTGYWTKKYGYIAKGTVCVKNRKRNPLNPRALSRSLARVSSAKSAVHYLAGVEIPKRCRRR